MSRAAVAALLLAALAACAFPSAARAGGRTVEGTVVRVDARARTLSVRDGLGTVWPFSVDRDAGIDLSRISPGMRVEVVIRRATPLNMSSPADRVRKGDRVRPLPPGGKGRPRLSPPSPMR